MYNLGIDCDGLFLVSGSESVLSESICFEWIEVLYPSALL